MKRMLRLLPLCLCLGAVTVEAQVAPGRVYVTPVFGPLFSKNVLLRATAIYPTPRVTDPDNPVVTEIKLDPGVFVGARFGYGLSRRLTLDAEFDLAVAVCAIRQLEIRDDSRPGSLPQYETTTIDARIFQYSLNLSFFPLPSRRVQPSVTFGFGNHDLDLRRKGSVNPDPVHDRAIIVGLGMVVHATDRLRIFGEVRDFMYSFRFDNQFVDPVESQLILSRRPEFYRTTSIAAAEFQNDLAFTVGFSVRTF